MISQIICYPDPLFETDPDPGGRNKTDPKHYKKVFIYQNFTRREDILFYKERLKPQNSVHCSPKFDLFKKKIFVVIWKVLKNNKIFFLNGYGSDFPEYFNYFETFKK